MLARSRYALLFAESAILAVSANAQAADPPVVRGLLATAVRFDAPAGDQLAAAVCELLAQCTFGIAASEKEWADAGNACHLSFTFAQPRSVKFAFPPVGGMKLEHVDADQMIVTFPLTRASVFVRSGNAYARFAKWPGSEHRRLENPIQSLLKLAAPSD